MSPVLTLCFNYCICVCAVWPDGVFKQYAVKMADLALSICSGGRLGHQPQQPHLHVSLASASCNLLTEDTIDLKHFMNQLESTKVMAP